MKNYGGHDEIKYRFWEEDKKKMTYMSIRFPSTYNNDKIYLKDIISEKDGVKFSLIMMKKITGKLTEPGQETLILIQRQYLRQIITNTF